MVTLTQRARLVRPAISQGAFLWLGAVSALTFILVLLSMAIRSNPTPSQDIAVMDWVLGWDLPALGGFFRIVSLLTSAQAGGIYGTGTIALFLVLGKRRAALAVAVVGAVIALVAVGGNYTLGELVGRFGPDEGNPELSFPSGHVFGSSVFFGFSILMAVHYRLRGRIRVPLIGLLAGLMVAVGPARIYEQAHWPSDVAAGYILGALWLLVLVSLFFRFQKLAIRPPTFGGSQDTTVPPRQGFDPPFGLELAPEPSCIEGCRTERSIASVVVLDPHQGTATKTYKPPWVVRLIYWLAFQAKFPYESNPAALQVAAYRRKIASFLTINRFGKDLVAPVIAINQTDGLYSFVTEFVPGPLAENDGAAKHFLQQVSTTFGEAGLSIWQVNPRNPHAHTNLIQTTAGDFKVIDLESAIATPFPGPGQWRSSLKNGSFPVFDDIDFTKLRGYIVDNEASLEASLGSAGMAELWGTVDRCERGIHSWKDAEPRIWGRLASLVYRLLDWKAIHRKTGDALAGADRAVEGFLNSGIDRWVEGGRLLPSQASELRTHLSTSEARDALHHLGAHLVITAFFRFPFGSPVRFVWTAGFWLGVEYKRLIHRSRAPSGSLSNIHNPVVLMLSLVPGFGGMAYLAARPLRRELLVRLVADQISWKLPFGLYRRMGISKWLAPAPVGYHSPAAIATPARADISNSASAHTSPVSRAAAQGLLNGSYPPAVGSLPPSLPCIPRSAVLATGPLAKSNANRSPPVVAVVLNIY